MSVLPKYLNVRPAMKAEIPWPWKTFGMEKCPEIIVPDISSYYDFGTYMIEDVQEDRFPSFGTRNFKSIFSLGCRFVGLDKMLTETPDLNDITHEYEIWNRALLRHSPVPIDRFVLGDMLGDEYDSYLKPDLFRTWILPEYKRLRKIAEDADMTFCLILSGDISSLLTDILTLAPSQLAFEPVGGMEKFRKEKTLDSCALFPMEKV